MKSISVELSLSFLTQIKPSKPTQDNKRQFFFIKQKDITCLSLSPRRSKSLNVTLSQQEFVQILVQIFAPQNTSKNFVQTSSLGLKEGKVPLTETWLKANNKKLRDKTIEKTDRDGLSARLSPKGKITYTLRYQYLGKGGRVDIGSYLKWFNLNRHLVKRENSVSEVINEYSKKT